MAVFETRRSILFTPGNHEQRMAKALQLGADTVCYDLEDAVAPDEKEAAREAVLRVLRDVPPPIHGPERCVRLNPLKGDLWRADLQAALGGEADAVMVPKAEDPLELAQLGEALAQLEASHGIRAGQTRVLLVIETATGVLRAMQLAEAAGARLGALLFGAEDLAADAGLVRTRAATEVLYARSHVALVAAAAGTTCVDQVFPDIGDTTGLEEEARLARTLGYSGKMAIHPGQIAPIHRAFTPSQEEVARAQRLLEAASAHGGVFRFEGRMIDAPLVRQAERVVRVARRAGIVPATR